MKRLSNKQPKQSYREVPRSHLSWKIVGPTGIPIKGFCYCGELFAFLGVGDLKSVIAKRIVMTAKRPFRTRNTVIFNGKTMDATCPGISFLDFTLESVLYEDLTVLETLRFSAELRAASEHQLTSRHPPETTALRLLTDVELKRLTDNRVKNLSTWERRFLLIATEIVADHETILIFDQPTKDLDAASALELITALQRICRSGRMILVTSGSLTFREFAILDKIQMLTQTSCIYFGLGSSAVSYFGKLGRKPSPGDSISDFLFDLCEDPFIEKRFMETLEREARKQGSALDSFVDDVDKEEIEVLGATSEAKRLWIELQGVRGTLLTEELAKRQQLRIGERTSTDLHLSLFAKVVLTCNWCMECGCLQTTEEDLPLVPLFFRQISFCMWRAFTIRIRNGHQMMGIGSLAGLFVALTLLIIFSGLMDNDTNTVVFLTIFPFCVILLSCMWNEGDLTDRGIFAFERERNYYSPICFPISAFVADVCVYRMFPVVLSGLFLYPMLGLGLQCLFFVRFMAALAMMAVAGAGMSKTIFAFMAIAPDFIAVKASMVNAFLLTIQLLFSGLVLDFNPNSWQFSMRRCSFFYWVCDVCTFFLFSFLLFFPILCHC